MNLHEYETKLLLEGYGVKVPKFDVVASYEELEKLVKEKKLSRAVLKIQVHAGGRGKAGGVLFAKSSQEILEKGKKLIGFHLVNQQTGKQGVIAKKLLVSEPVDILQEFYLGLLIDRSQACPLLIASCQGGMEIEEIAIRNPEKILKLPLRFDGKICQYQMLELMKFMGFQKEVAKKAKKMIEGLISFFMEKDGSMLEINPLVLTHEQELLALDAKFSLDDNASFRQPEIVSFYDPSQVSVQEVKAKEVDLAYIATDGDIGCMVNGAGLAMATMDIIQLYGGAPANFLDVGGGASMEKVAEGFKIILSDPKVKAILVNIFGGIMNCATIAKGVLAAVKELGIEIPLVVRLEGTNAEEGRELFQKSNQPIHSASSLKEAAELAVMAAKGRI